MPIQNQTIPITPSISLTEFERRLQTLFVGKPLTGKTELLLNKASADIHVGNGLLFATTKSQTIDRILDAVPSSRVRDVVVWRLGDYKHPISLNALEGVLPNDYHVVASAIVNIFETFWGQFWGPQSASLLRNGILAQLPYGGTLLGVYGMLLSESYRARVVPSVKDSLVKAYWHYFDSKDGQKKHSDLIPPLKNKLEAFFSPPVRHIIGQETSTIDLGDILDTNKILLIDASRSSLGIEDTKLLVTLILKLLVYAAHKQQRTSESPLFPIYLDQFERYANPAFIEVFSEAADVGLAFTVAVQSLSNLDPAVRTALLANFGNIGSFRIGAFDAELLANEFTSPTFANHSAGQQDSFFDLKTHNYEIYFINGTDGEYSQDTCLKPLDVFYNKRDSILAYSRDRDTRNVGPVVRRLSKETREWTS